MMSLLKKIKKYWYILPLASIVALLSFRNSEDNAFELSRNLDIFSTLMRELTIYYVDTADYEALTREGIDAMLASLDPYTQFIPEEDFEDYQFITTGQYGGIGALIGQRGDSVLITDPYEGYPAQKAGLMAGDIIVAIDGKSVRGKGYDEVSKLLKGQPNTNLSVTVERGTPKETLTRNLVRSEIQIPNVPYAGLTGNQTGYIRLSGFTENAGLEVRNAVLDLTEKKGAKGIILDLRSNPGGLLNEAVNVVNVFVPKGQEVVSTRGKVKEWDKTYRALNNPTNIQVPLVILVNSGSASAAEIVSGALQDLDRAVVIGQRTFGKGLVQTTRPLSYNSQLKVTTAKYYIPSGRCIQAIDYAHRNPDGSVGKVPDSLMNEFTTKGGRKVYDGGGILPDYSTSIPDYGSITQALIGNYLIFDYATQYRIKNPVIVSAKDFRISDAMYEDFVRFVRQRSCEYTTESERKLSDLKTKAIREKYFDGFEKEFAALEEKIKHDNAADLLIYKDEIRDLLENEICSRYYFQNGRIENNFHSDPDILLALKALENPEVYTRMMDRTFKN